MRRILVIGISGAGKSTFSRTLGACTGLPVIHLDTEFWQPGWKITLREPWRARVAELAARDAWIMDGNYSSTWDLRLPRAQVIIWLDLPRSIYFARSMLRVLANHGRIRPDLAPGCPERFDWTFVKWAWSYPGRDHARTIATLDRLRSEQLVVVLRSPAEVRDFEVGLPGTLVGAAM